MDLTRNLTLDAILTAGPDATIITIAKAVDHFEADRRTAQLLGGCGAEISRGYAGRFVKDINVNAVSRIPDPRIAEAEAEHERLARNRASEQRPVMRGVVELGETDRPAFRLLVLHTAVQTATAARDARRDAYRDAPKTARKAAARDFRQAVAVLTAAQRALADHLRETPHNRAIEAHLEVERLASTDTWRRRTKLDGMLKTGQIDTAMWIAGAQYRADREVGEMGARDGVAGSGGGGSGCPTQVALDAVGRLRAAREKLRSVRLVILMDCLADDLPWSDTARRMAPESAWGAATGATDPDAIRNEARRWLPGLAVEALTRLVS